MKKLLKDCTLNEVQMICRTKKLCWKGECPLCKPNDYDNCLVASAVSGDYVAGNVEIEVPEELTFKDERGREGDGYGFVHRSYTEKEWKSHIKKVRSMI